MSAVSITRARGSLSAHTPPMARTETIGSIPAKSTIPTSVGLSVRSVTNSARATITTPSPIALALCANHRFRKLW